MPKIDCGACGSPSCSAFAEDVVKGEVSLYDCVFMLPEKFKNLSQELASILKKSHPSSASSKSKKKKKNEDKK